MDALTAFRTILAGITDEFFSISISIGDEHIRAEDFRIKLLNVFALFGHVICW